MINETDPTASSSGLAIAYGEREYLDDVKFYEIGRHFLDIPHTADNDEKKLSEIANNARRAQKIIVVGSLNMLSKAIESKYKEKQIVESLERRFLPLAEAVGNGHEITTIVTPIAHKFSQTLYNPMNERSIIHILRLTKSAQKMSQEYGQDPAEFFRDDELFTVLTRSNYSPTEYVEQYKRFADGYTKEAYIEALCCDPKNLAKLSIPSDQANQLTQEQLSSLSQHIKKLFFETPELVQWVGNAVLSMQSATRGKLLFDVRRFWGGNSIKELPPHLQQFLRG